MHVYNVSFLMQLIVFETGMRNDIVSLCGHFRVFSMLNLGPFYFRAYVLCELRVSILVSMSKI